MNNTNHVLKLSALSILILSACGEPRHNTLSEEEAQRLSEEYGISIEAGAEIASGVTYHKNKCCIKAYENAIHARSIPRRACSGTRWTSATPGQCLPKKGKICEAGLQGTVTTTEYTLAWNGAENQCVATATGSTNPVQVHECNADECE